jgi:hypothetical protein
MRYFRGDFSLRDELLNKQPIRFRALWQDGYSATVNVINQPGDKLILDILAKEKYDREPACKKSVLNISR